MATTYERMTSLHLAHFVCLWPKDRFLGSTTRRPPFHPPVTSIWRNVGIFDNRVSLPHLPPVAIAQISVLVIAVLFPEIPCPSRSLAVARNWTEETWIQSCKTSSFDHDNHSF
jgi:hypothetical protein